MSVTIRIKIVVKEVFIKILQQLWYNMKPQIHDIFIKLVIITTNFLLKKIYKLFVYLLNYLI